MPENAGYVWTVAVFGEKSLYFRKYPATCGRGLLKVLQKLQYLNLLHTIHVLQYLCTNFTPSVFQPFFIECKIHKYNTRLAVKQSYHRDCGTTLKVGGGGGSA